MQSHIIRQRSLAFPTIAFVLAAVTWLGLLGNSSITAQEPASASDEVTLEVVGHFGGWLASVGVPPSGGSIIYTGEGNGLIALDVSNPAMPQAVDSLPFTHFDVSVPLRWHLRQ